MKDILLVDYNLIFLGTAYDKEIILLIINTGNYFRNTSLESTENGERQPS